MSMYGRFLQHPAHPLKPSNGWWRTIMTSSRLWARRRGGAHLSPYAFFSRAFHRWVGVSPKVFIKHLTLEHLKERLLAGADLMSATLSSGLSGTGRVHDHFVTLEAMTPGEFRRQGQAVVVEYGWHDSPFGEMLARCDRARHLLCSVHYYSGGRNTGAR
jgi:AraC family transcriptional regulator, regulatory protein of adaptative response / methylated-DNA-[protein]-cysteine methyltransferase